MKMKLNIWILPLIVMGLTLILANSCKKDDTDSSSQEGGILFNPKLTYGTVKDIDGNVYKTISIGTQVWMAENLKVTRYRNGDSISKVADNSAWYKLTTGAYCNYSNSTDKGDIYGKLYNWHAVNDPRNLCPSGWHVPNDAEWEKLFEQLGGYQVIGGKMKETGINHWAYINDGATNESGFTGLPGGMRYFDGGFIDVGQSGYWWSSTDAPDYYNLDAYYQFLSGAGDNNVGYGTGSKNNGISIRCLKD
ncbi:MAG: fibrobacter succinogenes major paralogous domain-containing protein [Lentimicrobiaceae bacterium]|jgi:uncharacterized protein (TIGR02145 family)